MKRIQMMVAGMLVMFSLVLAPVSVGAVSVLPQCAASSTASSTTATTGGVGDICASKNDNIKTFIKNVVNVLFYVVGVLAIIMLIYGGIRYVTSAGNSNQVTAAKNTITFALIGLVVSVLAYAIVNFVILAVTTGKAS